MPKLPKIRWDGDDAARVDVTGDPRNQEPTHVRLCFPGGEVEVTRAKDGEDADYWIHLVIDHPQSDGVVFGEKRTARVSDARVDLKNQHASSTLERIGCLGDPDVYHVAIRVTRVPS